MQMTLHIFLRRLVLVLLATPVFVGKAQQYDPEKVDKKAGEIYGRGYEAANNNDYVNAIKLFTESLKIDPKLVDAYLSRSGVYANLKNYTAAVNDFEKALSIDSVYSKVFYLPYSISLAGMGNFQRALNVVNEFLATPGLNAKSIAAGNSRKRTYEFAAEYEKKHPFNGYLFAPKNMGDSINSKDLEYFPSFTIDGKKMIYNKRINNDEDFYESDFINGTWSKAKPIGGKVNTNLNEGAQNISQDGQLLMFTGCNYPEGEGSCDLYFSVRTNTGWSEAQNLGPVINTDWWESSPSLSPDKRDLYFASSRAGGFGGRDIWVTHRLSNGKWSRPENLGEAVNTSADESCPFMHADNQSLYFNSNGHRGYGMTDLFISKKVNDSSWTVAENLGYPINTIDDEGSLVVTADGQTAYYASERSDSRGGLDLYSFTLRKDIQPSRTLWVKGKVFDKKTGKGLPSLVELTDINTRNVISRLQTDEDGQYLVTLPEGKSYAFNVNRKGYLFYSDNFYLNNPGTDSPQVKDIPLQPIEAGALIVLKNIFFDNKSFELKPSSLTELDKLVLLMNENPKLNIRINGHTDNVGQPKDNLLLSDNRAKAVVQYLSSKGIPAQRLSGKGFGETVPLADNNTENGRALNRRTEVSVISN